MNCFYEYDPVKNTFCYVCTGVINLGSPIGGLAVDLPDDIRLKDLNKNVVNHKDLKESKEECACR